MNQLMSSSVLELLLKFQMIFICDTYTSSRNSQTEAGKTRNMRGRHFSYLTLIVLTLIEQ